MLPLQIVHSLISVVLIELTLVGHGPLVSIIDNFFESLRVSEISSLVLVLKCHSRRLVVIFASLGHVLRQISRSVDRRRLAHVEVRFRKTQLLIRD